MDNIKNKRFNQVHFLSITLGLSMLYFAAVGVKEVLNNRSISTAIIVNNNDALIVTNDEYNDYESNVNNRIFVLQLDGDKCYTYKVNEDDYVSINDLAVQLVGEDGNVTYYELERENTKTLINTK